ncbi:MAG: arylsulfatase [Hyphomicrobiaceae bacterium]|nr:arylsulfatase [Hyphomicrobiaceae bacterium]
MSAAVAGAEAQTTSPGPQLPAQTQQPRPPNILIVFGDDIGLANISHWNRGLMGYRTPNIDRIAQEGLSFTDYYGQQSCTAGRAAFITGQNPIRTGLTKVGLPGADVGLRAEDPTIATLLKALGYATGQFGKNHLGDRNEFLPTAHGFDEFFGNLYHLNAEEEPEHPDYPRGAEFRKRFGPRGVIRSFANPDGTQTIEDTGALTRKRMETIDEETLQAALSFIDRQNGAGKPFFVWWNATRMHFRTHVKPETLGVSGQGFYNDGMVEHDGHVGTLLGKLDDLGIANNTLVVYTTDNGPHFNAWPDAAITPFRSEKNSNWEGAYRVPAYVRWPGRIPSGRTLNGVVAHEDWMPTLLAVAGEPNVKERLRAGLNVGQRSYHVYLDGYNQLPYLTGQARQSPRSEFFYTNDDGQLVGLRYMDWKSVFLEQRAKGFGVWQEPFVELRVPKILNLRRDPFERADQSANIYDDWLIDHAFMLVPAQTYVARWMESFREFPPRQKPASFNLENVMATLTGTTRTDEGTAAGGHGGGRP